MRIVILLLMLVVAILLVVFGAQNTQLVSIHFLMIDTGYISLSLVIVISAVIGAVLASLLTMWGSIRRGFQGRRTANGPELRAAERGGSPLQGE